MPKHDTSDDDLMRVAAKGDEAAFTELMQRHRGWVCSLVHAFVHDYEQAEDITQEVFCRVYPHTADYVVKGRSDFYFRARHYSSEEGRWTTVDPLRYTEINSLYSYVEQNPDNYIDPSGLQRNPAPARPISRPSSPFAPGPIVPVSNGPLPGTPNRPWGQMPIDPGGIFSIWYPIAWRAYDPQPSPPSRCPYPPNLNPFDCLFTYDWGKFVNGRSEKA